MPHRIHITGASGSGTTTLGGHLALALRVPHHDTDDYYWRPTAIPFTVKRPVPDRLALMKEMFLDRQSWVLSGSLTGWGDPLIPHFDLVVLLTLDPALRLSRLKAREINSYGSRIAPGGDMAQAHASFMEWARGYDDPDFTSRSLHRHLAWCDSLPCPVLPLDSRRPVAALVTMVMQVIKA